MATNYVDQLGGLVTCLLRSRGIRMGMGCGICGASEGPYFTKDGMQACHCCYHRGGSLPDAGEMTSQQALGGLCASCGAAMNPKLSHQGSMGTICQSCALQDATFDAELAALELEEDGSFWLGFCAGLLGNMFGLAFVYQQGGRDTKRGAAWGIGVALALVLLGLIGVSMAASGH